MESSISTKPFRKSAAPSKDEGDRMLDDGFEEEVALIGAEVRQMKQ